MLKKPTKLYLLCCILMLASSVAYSGGGGSKAQSHTYHNAGGIMVSETIVIEPREQINIEDGNWIWAFDNKGNPNGSVMVDDSGNVTSVNLTEKQMEDIHTGSATGFVALTPSKKFVKIPRAKIIEKVPALQKLIAAEQALKKEGKENKSK